MVVELTRGCTVGREMGREPGVTNQPLEDGVSRRIGHAVDPSEDEGVVLEHLGDVPHGSRLPRPTEPVDKRVLPGRVPHNWIECRREV